MSKLRFSLRDVLGALVVAAAYFGAARLAFEIATVRHGIAVVWPSAGIAVAAVALGGRKMLLGVVVGTLAATLSSGEPVLSALISSLGNVLEAAVAFELLQAFNFEPAMRRVVDVITFIALAAILASGLAALFGALSEVADHMTGIDHIARIWRDWWLGDLTGVVVVGSAILVFGHFDPKHLHRWGTTSMLVACATVGALSYLILHGAGALPYVVLPLLFLLAFLYRQPGATIGALVVATVAVVTTVNGHGPFLGGGVEEALIRAETFMSVGGVTGLLVAAALSERVTAQDALARLAESESALVEAQHLASVGSFEFDLVNDEAHWSDEVFNITGYSRDDMPREWAAWRERVVAEDVERLDAFVTELRDTTGNGSIVHRLIRADGQVRWVELRLRYLADESGRVVDRPVRLLGTVHDITPEVIAEQSAQALFQHAPYAILVLDSSGSVLRSNAHAQRLFGLDAEVLDGHPVERVIYSPDGDSSRWYVNVADDGSQPAAELWGRRSDATEFPIEISMAHLPALAGSNLMVAVRDITRVREETETLHFQARHDSLTGLANRLMFLEHVELALGRARRSRRPLAVMFADLDEFKLVNDRRGHDVGDLLLVELAKRLTAAVRQGDIVARLGGDEFVALCEDVGGGDDALEVAQRLTEVAAEPFALAGEEHRVTLSLGLVMVTDADDVTTDRVLRDADAAMYAAKAAGKGRVAVFDPADQLDNLRDAAMSAGLLGAVGREELEVHFQPTFSVPDHRLCGFEALVRWRHRSRGLLLPADFIGVAEDSGHIEELGAWVLEQSCRQALAWHAEFPGLRLPISVNVSARELATTEYATTLRRILDQTGIDPQLLAVEVSEPVLLQDLVTIAAQLQSVKQQGPRVVLDDYGLGQSSVSALRSLGVAALKVDGAHVRELAGEDPDNAVISGARTVAQDLGVPLIAEGVESWAVLTRIQELGFDMAQGFVFGRPAPPEAFRSLLRAERECAAARQAQADEPSVTRVQPWLRSSI